MTWQEVAKFIEYSLYGTKRDDQDGHKAERDLYHSKSVVKWT